MYIYFYTCINTYAYTYTYIYIYIYIRVVPRVFWRGILAHISKVYFSKFKGLKGTYHSWKLFHKSFYNLDYLV